MKIPSVTLLALNTLKVIKRFPLIIIVALTGSITFTLRVFHYDNNNSMELIEKLSYVSLLAAPFLTFLHLFIERKDFRYLKRISLVTLISLPVLLLYFFVLDLNPVDMMRLAFLIITMILSVMLVYPYGTRIPDNASQFTAYDLWYFNKILFIRLLVSVLFTLILYAGLSLALLALDKLFGIEITFRAYSYLFIWLSGIFCPIFFLSGIPSDTVEFDSKSTYPKGLKVFTQYILLPVAFLYFLILYVYAATILLNWELPKGMVTALTLTYSAIGIISMLLIYPLINTNSNKWMSIFQNWFYRLLFPLIVLMCIAIFRRIDEYGITIDRYLTIVASVWLFGISFYFILSKKKNIFVIPLSLIIFGFLISYGPQSAFAISENSQLNRLNKYIEKYHLLDKENIRKTVQIKKEDYKSIESIVYYLKDFHASAKLDEFISKRSGLAVDSVKIKGHYSAFELLKLKSNEIETNFSASLEDDIPQTIDISGYDKMINFSYYESSEYNQTNFDNYQIRIDRMKPSLKIIYKSKSNDTLELDLKKFKTIAVYKDDLNLNDVIYTVEDKFLKIKILITKVSGDDKIIDHLEGNIFVKIKENL